MLNKNAQLLVDALRSGKYEQGYGRLTRDDKDCCLGVACKVAIKNGVELSVQENTYDECLMYDGASSVLPDKVADWLGFSGRMGSFIVSEELKKSLQKAETNYDGETYLTDLNDVEKFDFNQIADVIESQPEGMFKDE